MNIDAAKEILRSFPCTDLQAFKLQPESLNMGLELFDPVTKRQLRIDMQSIAQLSFSKLPNVQDACWVILELTLDVYPKGGQDILTTLGYGHRDLSGEVGTGREIDLYHLHLEGDLVLDVAAEHFSIGVSLI